MIITSTSRHTNSRGEIRGTIKVRDGSKYHTVKYQRDKNGHVEQWGANSDVLKFTWRTMAKLTELTE